MRSTRTATTTFAIAIAIASAVLAAGCGGGEPAAETVSQHGLTVKLPPGWQAARRSLTPNLTDPREVLVVATYPLRYRRTACAHVAGSALEDLGPADAFVTLQERGRLRRASLAGFPPRPKRFGPRLGGPSEASECVPKAHFADHWFTFSDGGRRFHVDVAFGPRTSARTRYQAWSILDRLRVDPAAKPDWPSG